MTMIGWINIWYNTKHSLFIHRNIAAHTFIVCKKHKVFTADEDMSKALNYIEEIVYSIREGNFTAPIQRAKCITAKNTRLQIIRFQIVDWHNCKYFSKRVC